LTAHRCTSNLLCMDNRKCLMCSEMNSNNEK
jgi:hypothetical protein